MVRDSYPVPRIDECLDALKDSKIFTRLDANCGYWKIGIPEDDRDKVTITCHAGLFRFF